MVAKHSLRFWPVSTLINWVVQIDTTRRWFLCRWCTVCRSVDKIKYIFYTTDYLYFPNVKLPSPSKKIKLKKKTLHPLFTDGVQLPQGKSHFKEAVYFLPLNSQKFLVLILSTSEGWKAESTLEPPSGFEHGTLDWKSNALTTRPLKKNPKKPRRRGFTFKLCSIYCKKSIFRSLAYTRKYLRKGCKYHGGLLCWCNFLLPYC